ncbi:MAG TPA: flagellar basal body-associated FliL family protein, partial [Opitutales bacterium]|nr:flagellar basal body-associated FliL family protein [Opitutales bacterium]
AAIPLVMIATWELYMMPSLKKLASVQAGAPAPAAEAPAHEEAAPKEEAEGETHGTEGEAASENTYELKDVVANLSGAMRSRYIKVSFTLEGKAKNFPELMKANEAKIRDATLAVLSDLTIQDLEEPGVKNIVRNNIIQAIGQALRSNAVEQLFFSEFVVQ